MYCLVFAFICCFLATTVSAQDYAPTEDGIRHVYMDKSGITIETRIVLDKEDEKIKIVFWQQTENGFIFKGINWKGDVSMTLYNGETIVLKDSGMHGHTLERGGYVGGFQIPDIYKRYTAYFLSDSECDLLKQHAILMVSYKLDDKYDNNLRHMEISDKNHLLKSQLTALGK